VALWAKPLGGEVCKEEEGVPLLLLLTLIVGPLVDTDEAKVVFDISPNLIEIFLIDEEDAVFILFCTPFLLPDAVEDDIIDGDEMVGLFGGFVEEVVGGVVFVVDC